MARGKRNLITNKFTYVFTQTFLHKHLNLLYDKCLQGVAVILILKEREAYEVWLVIPNPIIFNNNPTIWLSRQLSRLVEQWGCKVINIYFGGLVSGLSIRPLHFPTNFVPNNSRRDFLVVVDNAYGEYVDQHKNIWEKITFSSYAIPFRRVEYICICKYNVILLRIYNGGK